MLEDAFDLGVKHVTTNIAFSQIMGTGIEYEYDGKIYHFNKAIMDDYDMTISALSNKGMTVTVIILNDWNPNRSDLIYPGTKKSSNAFYYMFNGANEAGFEQTRAIAAFWLTTTAEKIPTMERFPTGSLEMRSIISSGTIWALWILQIM